MNLPFDSVMLPGSRGGQAQLRLLGEDHARDVRDFLQRQANNLPEDIDASQTVALGAGASLGLYVSDTLIGTLLASEIRCGLQIDVLYVDRVHAEDGLELLLLQTLETVVQQRDDLFIRCPADVARGGVREAALLCGFSRVNADGWNGRGTRRDLVKGIGPAYRPRAVVLIDYTYDFVADDGRLTAGAAAQRIAQAVSGQIDAAVALGDEIFVINDLHEEDDVLHPESALFPPHNIRGTRGRELYGSVARAVERAKAEAPARVHEFDKTRYSAFWATPLKQMLAERGIDTVFLMGVCTDICILHSAVDAYNEGFRLIIDERCTASFDVAGHAYALRHFQNSLDADIINGRSG